MAAVEGRRNNLNLLDDPAALKSELIALSSARCGLETLFRAEEGGRATTSSVMVPLGECVPEDGTAPEICLILNKRSRLVKQPGDLCFPGGTRNGPLDGLLGKLLKLPGSPLVKWPCWKDLRREAPAEAEYLSTLLATALRESWEEMRLNPFGVTFLGPLPSQCLVLFRRVIHPMLGWVERQTRFTPSWEVEKILFVPFRALLNPARYACHRLCVPPHLEWRFKGQQVDFPCFLFDDRGRTEILWGVTYRVVTMLIELVFGFVAPALETLPVVSTVLDETYVNGYPGRHSNRKPASFQSRIKNALLFRKDGS